MNKVEALQEKARTLRSKLELYAMRDREVEFVLDKMVTWFEDIEAGKIIPPRHDDFGRHFFNTEEAIPWFIKYPDLSHAEAEYAAILQGWELPPE